MREAPAMAWRLHAVAMFGPTRVEVVLVEQNLPELRRKGMKMLHYAIVFFVIAIIAAIFGFTGVAAGAAEIAQVLFFIFLVLFIVSLVAGLVRRGP
jgi:uncharacterized membrane protein YtjA (UPF0391 family)